MVGTSNQSVPEMDLGSWVMAIDEYPIQIFASCHPLEPPIHRRKHWRSRRKVFFCALQVLFIRYVGKHHSNLGFIDIYIYNYIYSYYGL